MRRLLGVERTALGEGPLSPLPPERLPGELKPILDRRETPFHLFSRGTGLGAVETRPENFPCHKISQSVSQSVSQKKAEQGPAFERPSWGPFLCLWWKEQGGSGALGSSPTPQLFRGSPLALSFLGQSVCAQGTPRANRRRNIAFRAAGQALSRVNAGDESKQQPQGVLCKAIAGRSSREPSSLAGAQLWYQGSFPCPSRWADALPIHKPSSGQKQCPRPGPFPLGRTPGTPPASLGQGTALSVCKALAPCQPRPSWATLGQRVQAGAFQEPQLHWLEWGAGGGSGGGGPSEHQVKRKLHGRDGSGLLVTTPPKHTHPLETG